VPKGKVRRVRQNEAKCSKLKQDIQYHTRISSISTHRKKDNCRKKFAKMPPKKKKSSKGKKAREDLVSDGVLMYPVFCTANIPTEVCILALSTLK